MADEDKQQSGKQPEGQPGGETPPSWEEWLKTQPAEVQQLYEGHVAGLKTALTSERQRSGEATKQLREALKTAEKGSAAEKSLQEALTRAEEAERRAAFYESAPADLVSTRLAWLAAQDAQAFKRDGTPDWDLLRREYPDLFRKSTAPAGNAGAGTQQPPAAKKGMNDFIRRAAGK